MHRLIGKLLGGHARSTSRIGNDSGNPLEGLESRLLFHLEVIAPLAPVNVNQGAPATTVNLANSFDNEDFNGTIARLATTNGNIDIHLFDQQQGARTAAPLSVANFLNYVNNGTFNNTIFHRSADLLDGTPFVLQGGGFRPDRSDISPMGTPTVPNEFSPTRSNVRGTVAYAKLGPDNEGGGPDSATTEFFVNLSDNSGGGPSLDSQNGGFTVFGEVINMSVVDAIAALPTVNARNLADPSTGPFTDLPVRNQVPGIPFPSANDLVVVNTASVIPEITFTAVSSNPDLVNPAVNGGNLVLNYGAGRSGTATVTVTATDVTGATLNQQFNVSVTGGNELVITLGQGGVGSVGFADADGTNATISYKGGGSAAVRLTGSDLAQAPSGRGTFVTGTGIDIAGITLTGASGADSLTFKTGGGNDEINVGAVTADGSLKQFGGKGVALMSGLTVNGSVGKLDLARAAGGAINLTAAGDGATSITAGVVRDTAITVAGDVKNVKIESFNSTDGTPETFQANSIGKMSVAGDFQGGLTAPNGLRGATVKGGLGGGTWNVGGAAGKVSVGGSIGAWNGVFGGDLAGFTVNGDLSGGLTANSAKSVSIKGNAQAGSIGLNATSGVGLGKLTVGGAMSNFNVHSGADIGKVTVGSIVDSNVYAGFDAPAFFAGPIGLPATAADFSRPAAIKGVSVKGRGGLTFVRSNIAATDLGKISLGSIDPVGVPSGLNTTGVFGVAGDRIASLAGTAGQTVIKLSRLDDPAEAQALVAQLGGLGSFAIRVF